MRRRAAEIKASWARKCENKLALLIKKQIMAAPIVREEGDNAPQPGNQATATDSVDLKTFKGRLAKRQSKRERQSSSHTPAKPAAQKPNTPRRCVHYGPRD